MTVHALHTPSNTDLIQQTKIHLAAALRLAVHDGFDEGIDNHFTVSVPGQEDQYMVLPFGLHWSEACASNLLVFNEAGETLEGDGVVELSARSIHAPLHRITGAKVVLHTHQPWALALNMLKDNRLLAATQTAAFFHERIAYDDTYTGLAASLNEGERLASLLQNKSVMFLKNHGVITVGDTVAQAYRLLYKLEKACKTQVLAMSTGRPINILEEHVIDNVRTPSKDDRHSRSERERLYFEAMMRVLDRVNPGYAD
nr:class II aldolase/adducin family protein [uncultured Limnohabitans sp.]